MTKKNLVTVITDHQLTADTIATAIGTNEKHDGYYLGNGYAVTWTNGSVIEANFQPETSFVLSTNMDPRHVFAHNFKFEMRDYDRLVGYNKTAHDKAQLATIKSLVQMSHTVVNAMSPELDGELDFLSLYYWLGIPVAVRRAWLPILTKPYIVKAVTTGVADTAKYEQWLHDGIYNRLVKLCKDDAELRGATVVEEISVADAAAQAETVGIEAPEAGTEIEVEKTAVRFTPGATLLNLPQMLVAAACELDFTHEKTIETALKLYGKKLISYPVTQQNTVPDEVWRMMCHNKQVLRYNSKWGKRVKNNFVSRAHNFRSGENEFNGHGIVTTGLHPTDLTRDEEKLYNLIVKRVLDAFTPVRKRGNRKNRKALSNKKSHKRA